MSVGEVNSECFGGAVCGGGVVARQVVLYASGHFTLDLVRVHGRKSRGKKVSMSRIHRAPTGPVSA